MKYVRSYTAMAVIGAVIFVSQPATAESFDWIMDSISQQGEISNGDGHYWTFRKRGDRWEVVGKDGMTANVTHRDENLVNISGFPSNWNADGRYAFSRDGNKCRLRSKYSSHNMKWDC